MVHHIVLYWTLNGKEYLRLDTSAYLVNGLMWLPSLVVNYIHRVSLPSNAVAILLCWTISIPCTPFSSITSARMMLTMWLRWWPWHDTEMTIQWTWQQSQNGSDKKPRSNTKSQTTNRAAWWLREQSSAAERGFYENLHNRQDGLNIRHTGVTEMDGQDLIPEGYDDGSLWLQTPN